VNASGEEHTVLIGIGSNVQHRELSPQQLVRMAIRSIVALLPGARSSALFSTPCHPPGAGPDYINAAVLARWAGPTLQAADAARALMAGLHRIEADAGRQRRTRWASRTLDLDLLAFGDLVLPDPGTQTHWRGLPAEAQRSATPEDLIVPHPRLQDRAFVLVPLATIAPGWCHPLTGRSVAQMLADLPQADRAAVVPVSPEGWPKA
jgi:2-amino-4-hydroxy-6-hydroxymethyldihydropteridine diphosphokinase